jgi:hypothetical protein
LKPSEVGKKVTLGDSSDYGSRLRFISFLRYTYLCSNFHHSANNEQEANQVNRSEEQLELTMAEIEHE